MARAAVLIGVNRTGNLPKLSDAVEGAKNMAAWALAPPQSMKPEHVLLFTDDKGPVEIGEVRRAIRKLVESATVEQLIVYFAGHGVNIRYNEYWLLSDAPIDASAAVNVDGSVALARHCGIPHVVFISDACRTAAEGVQAQGVTGGEIFPNDPVPGPEASVDIFFGTTLGRPALEVKSPEVSSQAFEAVYTSTLLDAFRGRLPAALKIQEIEGYPTHVVRPRPLKNCLANEVPKRLANLTAEASQTPDARITSDEEAWLVRFGELLEQNVKRPGAGLKSLPPDGADEVLDGPFGRALQQVGAAATGHARRGVGLEGFSALRPISSFWTRSGFEVRGMKMLEAIPTGGAVQLLPDQTGLRVAMSDAFVSVLLVFEDGSSALLPALRDQVTLIEVDPAEGIVNVSYEPTGYSRRWSSFASSARDLRHLRQVAAAAARDNLLRIDRRLADRLEERMRYGQHLDPSLALYTAYALHDAGMQDQLKRLAATALSDIGAAFLDLALLSRTPLEASKLRTPILSRGWPLLSALGVAQSPELDSLRRTLRESLWTHFGNEGTQQLTQLISDRRLQ